MVYSNQAPLCGKPLASLNASQSVRKTASGWQPGEEGPDQQQDGAQQEPPAVAHAPLDPGRPGPYSEVGCRCSGLQGPLGSTPGAKAQPVQTLTQWESLCRTDSLPKGSGG